MATLRLALAQLNVTVGDLDGNRRLIEEAIRRAQAWMADLVVVPELALPGYPPEDLLLKPQFVEANLQALQRLTSAAQGLVALVGYVDRDPQGRLYSAAAVLTDGRRVATYRKQCLPNYGVFDEQRYFTPGSQPLVVEVRGVRVGVTICEDLWEEAPCRAVAASGAQVVANFLLSPLAQARKADIAQWGDPTVLALDKLPAPERARFNAAALPGQVEQTRPTILEPHGSWVDPLEKEWLRRYG